MSLSKEKLKMQRQAIERRRLALTEELRGDAARSREESYGALAGPVTDTADEAVADLLSDLDNAELSRDLAELRELEAARERLAQGSYGVCAHCGDDIPFERLAAEPAALRCIACQRVHEKTFAGPREPKL